MPILSKTHNYLRFPIWFIVIFFIFGSGGRASIAGRTEVICGPCVSCGPPVPHSWLKLYEKHLQNTDSVYCENTTLWAYIIQALNRMTHFSTWNNHFLFCHKKKKRWAICIPSRNARLSISSLCLAFWLLMFETIMKQKVLCRCICRGVESDLHCTWMSPHRGGRLLQANLILWRILKDFLSSLKHIVIILIRFITQAESSAFLPIVFHSQEKLERNKGGWASQSGPIVPHTVTSGVCKKLIEWVNTWLWGISTINFGLFPPVFIQEAFIFLERISGSWNRFCQNRKKTRRSKVAT